MEKIKEVSPDLGSETQKTQHIRKMLVTDLRTAMAFCSIIMSDQDSAMAVLHHLQKHVKNFPEDIQGLQKDARIAFSLLQVIIGHDLILDQVTDVLEGLRNNEELKQALKQHAHASMGSSGNSSSRSSN